MALKDGDWPDADDCLAMAEQEVERHRAMVTELADLKRRLAAVSALLAPVFELEAKATQGAWSTFEYAALQAKLMDAARNVLPELRAALEGKGS